MASGADTFRPDFVTEVARAIDSRRRPTTHVERRHHGRPEGPRGAAGRHSDGGHAGSKRCVEVERQRRQGRRDAGVPGGASTEYGGQDEASERVRRAGADGGQHHERGGGRRCRSKNARLGAGLAYPRSHPGAAAQRARSTPGRSGSCPRQRRPIRLSCDARSAAASYARSCRWPTRRSTNWNGAGIFPSASSSRHAASYGTWPKSKPGCGAVGSQAVLTW
jgi:hypothetical protein